MSNQYSHRTVKELKAFIRKYNAHFRIMLTGKTKAQLINDIDVGMKKTITDELKQAHNELITKPTKKAAPKKAEPKKAEPKKAEPKKPKFKIDQSKQPKTTPSKIVTTQKPPLNTKKITPKPKPTPKKEEPKKEAPSGNITRQELDTYFNNKGALQDAITDGFNSLVDGIVSIGHRGKTIKIMKDLLLEGVPPFQGKPRVFMPSKVLAKYYIAYLRKYGKIDTKPRNRNALNKVIEKYGDLKIEPKKELTKEQLEEQAARREKIEKAGQGVQVGYLDKKTGEIVFPKKKN